MTHQPLVEQRDAQPYVGVRFEVRDMAGFRSACDRGFPELFGWLGQNGVEPAGPPFIRYLVLGADGQPREFELAAPVREPVTTNGTIRGDFLPAGPYVTVLHVGPYRSDRAPDLSDARAALLDWAREQGIAWDSWEIDRGTSFRGCVEHYMTDAAREPDSSRWRTEIAYLAADE
jgi:hypothetical protein